MWLQVGCSQRTLALPFLYVIVLDLCLFFYSNAMDYFGGDNLDQFLRDDILDLLVVAFNILVGLNSFESMFMVIFA